MRVLYFSERFWPYIGGVEVLGARLLPAIARLGVEFTVVTATDGNWLPARDRYAGMDVVRFPMVDAVRARDVEAIVEIRHAIASLRREVRPDLVHLVFTGASCHFALASAHVDRAPTLVAFHGSWNRAELSGYALLHQAIAHAAWVTACSRSALDDLHQVSPRLAGRSQAILNGLEAGPEPDPPSFDPPLLLFAGRLVFDKGLDVAVEALARVRERHPSVRLLVAGEGPAQAEVAAMLGVRGLDGCVQFLGWRSPDAMAELIAQASVVVVPSRQEGFGLVALEGMLGGRPVVASDVDGLPEVLGHDGGVLVPPDDPGALAGAVLALLDDPAAARTLGAAARARALEHFTLERCAAEHAQLYERLTSADAA